MAIPCTCTGALQLERAQAINVIATRSRLMRLVEQEVIVLEAWNNIFMTVDLPYSDIDNFDHRVTFAHSPIIRLTAVSVSLALPKD